MKMINKQSIVYDSNLVSLEKRPAYLFNIIFYKDPNKYIYTILFCDFNWIVCSWFSLVSTMTVWKKEKKMYPPNDIFFEGLLPSASVPHWPTPVTWSLPRPPIGQVHQGSTLSESTWQSLCGYTQLWHLVHHKLTPLIYV